MTWKPRRLAERFPLENDKAPGVPFEGPVLLVRNERATLLCAADASRTLA